MKEINKIFNNADEVIFLMDILNVGYNDDLLLSLHSLRMEEIWNEERRANK